MAIRPDDVTAIRENEAATDVDLANRSLHCFNFTDTWSSAGPQFSCSVSAV